MKILWVVNTGIFYATKIGKPCLIEIELRTDIKWGAQEKPCTSIKRFWGPLPTIPLGRWVNFVALAGNIGLKLTIPLNWGTFWPIDFCQKVLTLTVLMHVRYNIPCQNIYPCVWIWCIPTPNYEPFWNSNGVAPIAGGSFWWCPANLCGRLFAKGACLALRGLSVFHSFTLHFRLQRNVAVLWFGHSSRFVCDGLLAGVDTLPSGCGRSSGNISLFALHGHRRNCKTCLWWTTSQFKLIASF